jgi:hypothetical protein
MTLKPLSIGEIVDRSTSLWRAHWRELFQVLLGFQLAQYVTLKAVELLIDRTLPAMKNPAAALELMKADPSTWVPQAWPIMVALGISTVLNLLLSQVAGVALTAFVYPRLTGGTGPTPGDSLKAAAARLKPTVGMLLVSFAWTGLVGALFMLPGWAALGGGLVMVASNASGGPILTAVGVLLTLAGLVVLVLWFLVRFVLTSQVLAVEEVTALGCFKRTDALSSGRVGPGLGGLVKGRLTLLITIVAFILMVVGVLTGLPELVLKGLSGELTGGPTAAPQVLVVPAQLLQVIIGAAISPLYVVFQVVFYVDMRVRREGLDLELATRAAA